MINRAANAGIAMFPIASPKATTTMAITTPATTSDARVRAPAALFSDDAETDPPTGIPSNAPDAMFATPWPMKSRDGSG